MEQNEAQWPEGYQQQTQEQTNPTFEQINNGRRQIELLRRFTSRYIRELPAHEVNKLNTIALYLANIITDYEELVSEINRLAHGTLSRK